MTVLSFPPPPQRPDPAGGRVIPSHRALAFALVFVTALLVASWTGFIVWVSAHQLADAILRAGVAFAGTVGLCLGVWAAYRQR